MRRNLQKRSLFVSSLKKVAAGEGEKDALELVFKYRKEIGSGRSVSTTFTVMPDHTGSADQTANRARQANLEMIMMMCL